MDEELNEHNDSHEEDTLVFLDFNGKLPNDVFDEQVLVRIANLHKKNPLVQVNDSIYKGTYDYSMGTNLFFEEIEDIPPSTNLFEKQAPINLKHIHTEMKVLNLKPVRVRQKKITVPNEVTKIDFNFNWDYNELLEKFENGSLRIDDIVTKECQEQVMSQEATEELCQEEPPGNDETVLETYAEPSCEQPSIREREDENILENIEPIKILESDYKKLHALARRPVKRAVSPELVAKCDEKYEQAYEYHNIERQILQPSDAFRIETVTEINEETLCDCVDIDRCVLYGIIPPSSVYPRILSQKEKEKLFTLENFDNLSLAARYYVLRNHVHDLENYIKTVPKSAWGEDEFGRTPKQTLEIYKKLCEAVMNRLQEIKCSLRCENYSVNAENIENIQIDVETVS